MIRKIGATMNALVLAQSISAVDAQYSVARAC
jgi:hypothetical protein